MQPSPVSYESGPVSDDPGHDLELLWAGWHVRHCLLYFSVDALTWSDCGLPELTDEGTSRVEMMIIMRHYTEMSERRGHTRRVSDDCYLSVYTHAHVPSTPFIHSFIHYNRQQTAQTTLSTHPAELH